MTDSLFLFFLNNYKPNECVYSCMTTLVYKYVYKYKQYIYKTENVQKSKWENPRYKPCFSCTSPYLFLNMQILIYVTFIE